MYIEYISKKYKIDTMSLKREKTLNGSISAFCKKYIDTLVGNGSMKIYDDMDGKLINYFDMSNPYMVGDYSAYANLLMRLFDLKPGFIVFEPIEDILKDVMKAVLNKEEIQILSSYYGLDGNKKSSADLCRELGIDGRALRRILKKSIKKLISNIETTKLKSLRRAIIEKPFAEDVFKNILRDEDVFYSGKIDGVIDKKIQLITLILEREISNLEYKEDGLYINDVLTIMCRINSSVISQSKKIELREMLDKRKCEITNENKDDIVKYFQLRIDNCENKGRGTYGEIIKAIRWSGLDKEIADELISNIPKNPKEKKEKFVDFRARILAKIGFPHRDTAIDEMNISEKAKNNLADADFKTIGDIIKFNKQELLRFGNIQKVYCKEIFLELERLGFDIPEGEDLSIEQYNQDKMCEDSYIAIAKEIRDSDFKFYLKDSLLNSLFKETLSRLQAEYKKLDSTIAMYKNVTMVKSKLSSNNQNANVYVQRIAEAEEKKKEVAEQIDLLNNAR